MSLSHGVESEEFPGAPHFSTCQLVGLCGTLWNIMSSLQGYSFVDLNYEVPWVSRFLWLPVASWYSSPQLDGDFWLKSRMNAGITCDTNHRNARETYGEHFCGGHMDTWGFSKIRGPLNYPILDWDCPLYTMMLL